MCMNIILGYYEPDNIQVQAADYDQNLTINILDVISLVNTIINSI